MKFGSWAKMLSGCLLPVLAVVQAWAQSPAFINAVAFALTGDDDNAVHVVDPANCVFMINAKSEGGKFVGEVFHLNNVQVDRISIQPWKNAFSQWVQVELRGAATVYEFTGEYQVDATNSAVTREQQEQLDGLARPRRASSFTLKLYTTEYDRVVRAYQYIYQNGCRGSKSAF